VKNFYYGRYHFINMKIAAAVNRLYPPKVPDNPLPPNETPHPDLAPEEPEKPERRVKPSGED